VFIPRHSLPVPTNFIEIGSYLTDTAKDKFARFLRHGPKEFVLYSQKVIKYKTGQCFALKIF